MSLSPRILWNRSLLQYIHYVMRCRSLLQILQEKEKGPRWCRYRQPPVNYSHIQANERTALWSDCKVLDLNISSKNNDYLRAMRVSGHQRWNVIKYQVQF